MGSVRCTLAGILMTLSGSHILVEYSVAPNSVGRAEVRLKIIWLTSSATV